MLTTEIKSNGLAATNGIGETLEKVIIGGDLRKLTPDERVNYYLKTCESLGLNPLTRPFDYIEMNGKLTFYARKDATEQLRKLHNVSITKIETKSNGGMYVVIAYACTPDGRQDAATGAVAIENLKGDGLVNALLKAETKAKRRVTLSIVGLGMLDESETDTIPNAHLHSGEISVSVVEPVIKSISHQTYEQKLSALVDLITNTDTSSEVVQKWLDKAGAKSLDDLKEEQVDKCIQFLNSKSN